VKVGVTRRHLLGGAGAVIAVAFLPGCVTLPVIPKRPSPDSEAALSWIRYESGRYTLIIPRAEMGQNIATSLKQIACDELGITWEALDVQLHRTDRIRHVRATVGSESIMLFAWPLANACATLREAIEQGISTGKLRAKEYPRHQLRSLSGQGAWVGKSPGLLHAAEIVIGQPVFTSDVRLDGMLYGRVLRAPMSPEIASSVDAMDAVSARRISGFVAIVRSDNLRMGNSEGVGIVAETPGALDRIERALDVRWSVKSDVTDQSIMKLIDIDERILIQSNRDKYLNKSTIPDGAWDLDLRFDIPAAAHAAIEPRVAVSNPVGGDGLEMWVGSQDVFYQRDVVCRRIGLSKDQVVVHGCRIGGAFGGKTISTVELESAVLAYELKRPVKVQWTRAQEFTQAFHRPPSSHRVRVRLKDKSIQYWKHDFASSHILFTAAVVPEWLQKVTDFIGDDGVARGAALPYRTTGWQTGFDLVRLPVYTGPWRGLGAGPNCFVIESVVDECARLAGDDPTEFRLTHIEDPRLARVLREATASAPEAPINSTDALHGRGVACGIYKGMSYAAVVADVSVEKSTGKVTVLHMHCAHDCGMVVNPDQVTAQCEGNLVWGLGMVLVEKWTIGARNFGESPVPRISDVPSLTVKLVDNGEEPSGAGETAIVASGAAIANAIRSATGWRPQTLPIQPKDVMAALR